MFTPSPGPSAAHRLLAGYLAAVDPEAAISASTWSETLPYYDRLRAALRQHPWRDDRVAEMLALIERRPTDVAAYRHAADLMATDPSLDGADDLRAALEAVETHSLVRHHLGPAAVTAQPDPGDLAVASDVRALVGSAPPTPTGAEPDLAVVIPVRARPGDPGRLRNAVACVAAANQQTLDRSRYVVVVVEQDTEPRCAEVLSGLVDEYVFVVNPGAFNKSWALNIGAAAGRKARHLCLLDADVLVDADHFARIVTDLDHGPPALLPYGDLLNLDRPSSALAIRRRLAGSPDVPFDELRGFGLRDVWGACVCVTRALFETIGGYDERFRGWGDEDNEFYRQLLKLTEVPRWTRPLAHLWHARPQMVDDSGRRPNQHLSRTPRPELREPIGLPWKYEHEHHPTTGEHPA
nr:galactosyltransferase-related protein [Micromonospora sp. NBC_00855]